MDDATPELRAVLDRWNLLQHPLLHALEGG